MVMVGFSPAAKSSSNRYLAVAFIHFLLRMIFSENRLPLFWIMRVSVDQLVFAAALGDDDFTLGREILGDVHEESLRLVDVTQPDRSHGLHVFYQQLRGTARHVGEEELAHGLVGALERHRQLLLVDIAHQRLRSAGIE